MDPNMLTSSLRKYIPLKYCTIFEDTKSTDVKQRIENATTLLHILLGHDDEGWPKDLIQGLQETGQSPLASKLRDEYQNVVKERDARTEWLKGRNRGQHAKAYQALEV